MTLAPVRITQRFEIDTQFRKQLLESNSFGVGIDEALRSEGQDKRHTFLINPVSFLEERLKAGFKNDAFQPKQEAGFILGLVGTLLLPKSTLNRMNGVCLNFFAGARRVFDRYTETQADFIRTVHTGLTFPKQLDAYVNWRRQFVGELFPPKNCEIDFHACVLEGDHKVMLAEEKAVALKRMAKRYSSENVFGQDGPVTLASSPAKDTGLRQPSNLLLADSINATTADNSGGKTQFRLAHESLFTPNWNDGFGTSLRLHS